MEIAIDRREFFGYLSKTTLVAAAAGSSLVLSGCDVWAEAEQWVPVGITAFEQIVTLVTPLAAPGIDAIAETVKAGFSVLSAAIDQYRNAPANQKATLKQRVVLAFETLANNLQNFLSAVNIPGTNPIVKIVLGLVNILLSTIMGFVNRIQPTPATASRRITMAGQAATVTPVLRDRKKFKADWNAACVEAGHPELEVN